jgi:serine/threonine-protein kinase
MPTLTAEDREHALDEILAGYLRECDAGRPPDRRNLTAQFPDLASAIEEFLTEQEEIDQAFAPLRPVAQAAEKSGDIDGESTAVFPPVAASTHAQPDLEGYDILEPLGRGGMGVVYKARHRKLNRVVALKFDLTGPWAGAEDRQRFRAEAEVVAHLDHPNIVPIYEVGDSNGQAFLSMKLVDGGSLAGRLEQFRKDPKAAARLMIPVARAVHHAHQRGILHRDLKPANVLLDAAGQPYVSDFGLAKRVGPTDQNNDPTQAGTIIGTPGYIAPEQASGQPVAVTTASDVYGLGGILYAILTGRPPFCGDSMLDTLEQVKGRLPERPRSINPVVDRDLELICLKCLEKEPRRRYASAEALADELERYLAGKPLTQTRPVGRAERLWRWARRNPAWAALSAALTLAVAAIAVVSTMAYFRLRAVNAQERASRVRAEENLKVAREAVGYFATLSREPQMQKRGLEQTRRVMLTRARDFYATLANQQPGDSRVEFERAQAFNELGRMDRLLGANREAVAEHQQSREIGERLTSQFPDNTAYQDVYAQALFDLGTVFMVTGQWEEAEKVLSPALAEMKSLFEHQPADTASTYVERLGRAYYQVARLHQVRGQLGQARDVYGAALKQFEPLARSRPEATYQEHLARTHLNLGMTYLKQLLPNGQSYPGEPGRAKEEFTSAQGILEGLGKQNTDIASNQDLLATVYYLIGRVVRDNGGPRDAVSLFEKSLAIRTALSQRSDVPDYQLRLAILYHGQAQNFAAMKQYDRAGPMFAKAAVVLEPVVRDYDLIDARQELGQMYFNWACLAGVTAAAMDTAGPPADRKQRVERLAGEAIERLRKSWSVGYLQNRARFTSIIADPDLNAFRDRDDFKTLVAELEAKLPTAKSAAKP